MNIEDPYRAIIESSVEEFQRLSRMVDDMLFLARADARQRKTHFQLVDARHEALRVARYYDSIADDLEIGIAVKGAPYALAMMYVVGASSQTSYATSRTIRRNARICGSTSM